jgi:ribosome-binding protein aMBF1 (putative translation factor)
MTESFNQKDFSQRVIEELEYLGMERKELAKSTYISEHRIVLGLQNKSKFKPEEISSIEKVLGMN